MKIVEIKTVNECCNGYVDYNVQAKDVENIDGATATLTEMVQAQLDLANRTPKRKHPARPKVSRTMTLRTTTTKVSTTSGGKRVTTMHVPAASNVPTFPKATPSWSSTTATDTKTATSRPV